MINETVIKWHENTLEFQRDFIGTSELTATCDACKGSFNSTIILDNGISLCELCADDYQNSPPKFQQNITNHTPKYFLKKG